MTSNKFHGARIHFYAEDEVEVPKDRQRLEFDHQYIADLAASIGENGLFHPMVTRQEDGRRLLVAGECRKRAIQYLWNFGQEVRCAGLVVPEGYYPCVDLGELDPIDAYEAELEENIRRRDLTWQEKARATAKLKTLRALQAKEKGLPEPTVKELAADPIMKQIDGGLNPEHGYVQDAVRTDLIVAKHLHDPGIANAKSAKDALKLIRRNEELKRSAELGHTVGQTFSAKDHILQKGDCIELLKAIPDSTFDVILTDPPYGMGASQFGDSAGKVPGSHFYDDSPESFLALMAAFIPETYRVAKHGAHLYCFCDIDWFGQLKSDFTRAGWKVFRTPLTWINPSGMRIPWIDKGPQRKTQWCLFASKGDRNVLRLAPDVVTVSSDENLNHHAQKPVALFQDLLSRSAKPGDRVLDPFCGTGTIFPAAHVLKVGAFGIELDDAAYGIAVKRLGELK